jgi:hypothetical protein
MTSTLHLSARSSRRRPRPLARGRRASVIVVDGVQMSCDELSDDLALIRFACPPPRKRRARVPARET